MRLDSAWLEDDAGENRCFEETEEGLWADSLKTKAQMRSLLRMVCYIDSFSHNQKDKLHACTRAQRIRLDQIGRCLGSSVVLHGHTERTTGA